MRLSDGTSDYDPIIRRFIDNNIDTIRFNITRYSNEKYLRDIEYIRNLYKSINKNVAIMLDIPCPGSKFRSRLHDKLEIIAGNDYIFTSCKDDENAIHIPHDIITAAKSGSTLAIGDGELAFKITDIATTHLKATALNSGCFYNGRAVYVENFSNYYFNGYSEENYGELMRQVQPEYVVLSFAEYPEHILSVSEGINKSTGHMPYIISKIETSIGAYHIASLLDVSDAIMIGRGDMAMTSVPANLGSMQDDIITECVKRQKPVYVATDILNSMLSSYVPRRSEIIDVHHIVRMSASGMVLSAALSINENFPHAVSLINTMFEQKQHRV